MHFGQLKPQALTCDRVYEWAADVGGRGAGAAYLKFLLPTSHFLTASPPEPLVGSVIPGTCNAQASRPEVKMFNTVCSAILSPWNAPQKSLQELSSSSAFAQEICPKLIQAIKALPKESRSGTVHGLLPIKLADFQTNLSSLGNVLNNVDTDRTQRALNHLERLCCVGLLSYSRTKPHSTLADSKCIIVAESVLPGLHGQQQFHPGNVSFP